MGWTKGGWRPGNVNDNGEEPSEYEVGTFGDEVRVESQEVIQQLSFRKGDRVSYSRTWSLISHFPKKRNLLNCVSHRANKKTNKWLIEDRSYIRSTSLRETDTWTHRSDGSSDGPYINVLFINNPLPFTVGESIPSTWESEWLSVNRARRRLWGSFEGHGRNRGNIHGSSVVPGITRFPTRTDSSPKGVGKSLLAEEDVRERRDTL